MITFAELKNKSQKLYPAIILEGVSNYYNRRKIRLALLFIMSTVFILMVIAPVLPAYHFLSENMDSWLLNNIFVFRGLFFMFFSFWVMMFLLEAFYLSYYFDQNDVDFDVAGFAFLSDRDDIAEGFLSNTIGEYTILRLGISLKALRKFLKSDRIRIRDENVDLAVDFNGSFIGIKDYGLALYLADKSLRNFLTEHGVTQKDFLGALSWVDHDEEKVRNVERWWSRSRLARVKSLGRNWSFGDTYMIEKFANNIIVTQNYRALGDRWKIHEDDVEQIENILIKNSGGNVMLISPTTEIGMNITSSFGKMVFNGQIMSELEDKRIFVLDVNKLLSESPNSKIFEESLFGVLRQANKSGNVILVLPNISKFIESANKNEIDVISMLSDSLKSSNLQMIAISNKKGFYETVETNNELMQNFEKIIVEDIDLEMGIRVLEKEAHILEYKNKIFFTYQSLVAVSEAVSKYFSSDIYSDKILDILSEVVIQIKAEKRKVIFEDDVHKLVALKTGIPQGSISEEEKEKLVALEEILHRRVVGQTEAINAIAGSMRRGRAGITNPKRPTGSFLFIGPTGVGKTETTKALAENFFGSEEKVIRFDMSEYAGGDAVEKLIGSPYTKRVGDLAQKITNQQYGVLLLDEFEKTTPEVMNLFLQILDEGRFTDARGRTINARNLIIIATSNAGSDLIYELSKSGQPINRIKGVLIDTLIKKQIFTPELLNRFDGVILFETLTSSNLRQISKLMLRKLNKRLTEQGITIDVNDALLDYLVRVGNSDKFGAREMNRVIQNKIEVEIAEKIISKEIRANSVVKFEEEDGEIKIVN